MEIIILGTNPLACILATHLCHKGQEVTVISNDQQRLEYLAEELEIKIFVGHPSYPHILRNAGAESARAIIAVTENDELNMIACQVAHSIFNIETKVARISSPHYVVRRELFGDADLPIDVFINPDKIIARSIKHLLTLPNALDAFDMCHGQLKAFSTILPEGSALIGKSLTRFNKEQHTGLIMHAVRQGISLDRHSQLEAGDLVVSIGPSIYLTDLVDNISIEQDASQTILIAGATSCAEQLIKMLPDLSIKVIDPSHQSCLNLAKDYDQVTVIHADFADSETLLNESIEDVDLFCALTNDDEDNLISAIQAKKLGANRSLALINRHDYHHIIPKEQVDILLSPHHLVSHSIYTRIINQQNIRNFQFSSVPGSLVSIRINDAKQPLPKLPKDHIFIFRQHTLIPYQENALQKNDHLIFYNENKD